MGNKIIQILGALTVVYLFTSSTTIDASTDSEDRIKITGDALVGQGNRYVLTCNASISDYPLTTISWYRNGELVESKPEEGRHVRLHVSLNLGPVVNRLVFDKIKLTDAGTYECRMTDKDNSHKTFKVEVSEDSSIISESSVLNINFTGAEIDIQGWNETLEDQRFILSCVVSKIDYSVTSVDWYRNGEIIKSSPENRIVISIEVSPDFGPVTNRLIFERIKLTDDDTYECRVSGRENANDTYKVNVLRDPTKKVRVSGMNIIREGLLCVLTCNTTVKNYPLTLVRWYRNGNMINSDEKKGITVDVHVYPMRSVISKLTFDSIKRADEGTYVCQLTDKEKSYDLIYVDVLEDSKFDKSDDGNDGNDDGQALVSNITLMLVIAFLTSFISQ